MPVFLDPTGESSYGIALCARCSKKFRLSELYDDPNAPGLKVCIDDLDDYDPYRLAARPTEEINLIFVRPDRVLDATGPDSFTTLYVRGVQDGELRATESGAFRIIEEDPDGVATP